MRTYPSESKTETITFLDTVNDTPNKMNDDGPYPLSDISATLEDIHYQENNATSKRYN